MTKCNTCPISYAIAIAHYYRTLPADQVLHSEFTSKKPSPAGSSFF